MQNCNTIIVIDISRIDWDIPGIALKPVTKLGRRKKRNYPEIWAMWFYLWVKCPNGLDRIAVSVDPDQSAPEGAVLSVSISLSKYLGPLW